MPDQSTPIPSSAVAQAAQAASIPNVLDGVKLSRYDGKADLVPVELPSVPVRLQVYEAMRFATGYREGDEAGEPSGKFNGDDAFAVLVAMLGLCWRGKELGLPSYRDMSRDVVAYGEAVMGALLFAGYSDSSEQQEAGNALLQAAMQEVHEAVTRAKAGFPMAKRHR